MATRPPAHPDAWIALPLRVAVLAVVLVLLAACSATGADEGTRSAGQEGYVGVQANLTRIPPADRTVLPPVAGTSLDEKPLSTADYRGTVVVVNVWGSWCAPCRAEAPALQKASVATKGRAQFVGITTRDSDPAQARAFVRAFDIGYPSIFDPDGAALLTFAGTLPPSAIPSTLVLDAEGRLAVRVLGEISERTLVDMVDDVAAGQMTPLDLGTWAQSAVGGSMALAIPVALLAGLVSFFSPCVVPLLPGYLSYATGLGAAEVLGGTARRGRMLAGTSLFVLGIAVVFVATGTVVGSLGATLLGHAELISRVLGVVIIVLGLMFAGVLRLGRRDLRISRLPAAGVAAAPLLGVVFALGWTPCIGPTLGVVYSLAFTEGTALRGGLLAFVFALGLGVPFVVAGLVYTRLARAVGFLRRHQLTLLRVGGVAMVVVGLLLVSGLWTDLTTALRSTFASFVPVI